jgi:hypothetical protein
LNERKRHENKLSDEEILDIFDTYLGNEAMRGCCTQKFGGSKKEKKCDCLGVLRNGKLRETVSRYCLEYGKKNAREQKQLVIDWYRYARPSMTNHLCFLLPFACTDSGLQGLNVSPLLDNKVCISAITTVLGLGQGAWKMIRLVAKTINAAPTHGLTGEHTNRKRPPTAQLTINLHLHFAEIQEFTEPLAMRFPGEESGKIMERDGNDSNKYLPTSMGKRHCYGRYCRTKSS